MIRRSLCLAIALPALLATSTGQAAKYDVTVDANVSYRMWVPDNVSTVRGVLIHMNGSGDDDRTTVDDPSWYESFVSPMDFAYIGSFYQAPGSPDAVLTALSKFATMSNHPELANAPLLVEGISLGGYNAVAFAMEHPERTIGYVNAATRSFPPFKDGAKKTPGLHMIGSDDTGHVDPFVAGVTQMRAQGHQVAYFEQWGVAHKWGQGLWVGRNFLAACYVLRYPAGGSPTAAPVTLTDVDDGTGWLLDKATYDTPFAAIVAASGASNALTKFWAPSNDLASMIRGHATHQKPVSFVNEATSVWGPVEVGLGDSVPLNVAVDGAFPGVTKVQLYDGATLIKELTQAPYVTMWQASRAGTHGIVAVAVDGTGAQRTGFVLPVVVAGKAESGGRGGNGKDAGAAPADGGPGSADGDAGAPDAARPTAPSEGGANATAPGAGTVETSGGCGCREAVSPGTTVGAAGLTLLGAAALVRRRRRRTGR